MSKIFEIRIVHKDAMPEHVRRQIVADAVKKGVSFQKNFKGFAKVTYITNSPKSIQSVEPIMGTIIDYFEANKKEGVSIPSF